MKTSVLFLDLEETIIDDWSYRNFITRNIEYIRKCIDHRYDSSSSAITELGLFSYAIDNPADLYVFNRDIRSSIESALGLEFRKEWCLTKEDIKQIYSDVNKVEFINQTDFSDFCGNKGMTFAQIVPSIIKPSDHVSDVFLIDDSVVDFDIFYRNIGLNVSVRSISENVCVAETASSILIKAEPRDISIFSS